jgi:hypothetical protein
VSIPQCHAMKVYFPRDLDDLQLPLVLP